MKTPEPSNPNDSTIVALLTESQFVLVLYVRSLMPGDSNAHDVVQQTNAKIWEKRDQFEIGTNFRAWAYAIARFEVLNYRKQQARESRLTFSTDLENTIATELELHHDDMVPRHAALQSCLESLKPASRQLLLQRYQSTESISEFANRIGRSAGGLKVSLSRLRTVLAECIERRMVVENSQ